MKIYIIKYANILVKYLGWLLSLFSFVNNIWSLFYIRLYTEIKRREFLDSFSINDGVRICPTISIIGGECISVGKNVLICKNSIISAYTIYKKQTFLPQIIIGNNCGIGDGAHITAINKIILGDGVLLGKYVTITDNSHGNGSEDLNCFPSDRLLYSKGPVIIKNNVWIGDKVTILPNVVIGEGSIIGANTVVSKNVPAYSVVIGVPMKIIKNLKNE